MFNYQNEVENSIDSIRILVRNKLYRFSEEDREDVVQDILVRLIKSEKNFNVNKKDNIKGYIYTTSYNYIKSYLKKHKIIREFTVGEDHNRQLESKDALSPERILEGKTTIINLRKLLDERENRVLDQIEKYGMDVENISKAINLGAPRVYQLVRAIREKATKANLS